MDLPANPFKRAILAGKPQIGYWCSLGSSYVTEILGGAGFDWLLVDMEHSPNDLNEVIAQLQSIPTGAAGTGSPSHPVVRPPWNDMVLIKRLLDGGAQSLLIPYIQTAEEAAAAVAYTRYPPAGVRGVAGTTRATRFGRVPGYYQKAADEICVLVQIETKLGLDNLEAIARVEGVDGVFIGPADLAAGLGHLGNFMHPEVQAAITEAVRRIRACGKAAGFLAADEAVVHKYLDLGVTFMAVGQDITTLARESEKIARLYKK